MEGGFFGNSEFPALYSRSVFCLSYLAISSLSSSEPLHAFDLEIERTLHRLRKNSNFTTDKSNFSEHQEVGSMENNDRTLKELATPNVVYQLWCIQCLPLEPTQSEDPHKHLKEFHMVCSTMRPQGILEDRIKMKAFPFSLDGAAKDCLYLQSCMFLEKFFPVSRTTTIRKEICRIRQHSGKTLHEY
ncbi:hypothetical protein CR513_53104, partial [Mucuna pruriens]